MVYVTLFLVEDFIILALRIFKSTTLIFSFILNVPSTTEVQLYTVTKQPCFANSFASSVALFALGVEIGAKLAVTIAIFFIFSSIIIKRK